ncbi:MAG: GTPase domain-containing protein, partial [Planctomycetota bacterium]
MLDLTKSSATSQTLNVGVYGCTKAGKTRFLFELLSRWERTRRLLGQSETCQKFLATVESEIEKHDGSMPTVATTEGIRVKVRRDGHESPLELVFRDLRGELLSGELDQIKSLTPNGTIPTQVRQCDAFLFFFDPTSSENPAEIDTHHQRELKRASMFIEYVLKVRENRHLPIIFVQTHLDRWENDADIKVKADRWAGEVHAKLVELYDSGLRRFHPKSIVDRNRTVFRVSSVGNTPEAEKQLEKVVVQLDELVADSIGHRRRLRKSGLYTLAAGVVVLTLLPFVIWLLSSMGETSPQQKKSDDRTIIAELPEHEIVTKLDDLDRVSKSHPPGTQLPSVEEAKKLNHHLRWLAQRLEPNSGGTTGLTEKTQQRMRSAFDSLAKLVQEKAESKTHSPSNLTPILTGYLEDLPDLTSISPALTAVQSRYWQLERGLVVEQVASIFKRRSEVSSLPIDTLGGFSPSSSDLATRPPRRAVRGRPIREMRGVSRLRPDCFEGKPSPTSSPFAVWPISLVGGASD